MIENCSEACEVSFQDHNSILHYTYCNLVRHDIAAAEFDANFLRPFRVEVAQPQITYLPRLAKLREVLEGGKVAPILVVLPKELPPPGGINHATAVN